MLPLTLVNLKWIVLFEFVHHLIYIYIYMFEFSAIIRISTENILFLNIVLQLALTDLSIRLDDKLRQSQYVKVLVTRLCRAYYAIKVIRRELEVHTALTAYCAYFGSLFSYGILGLLFSNYLKPCFEDSEEDHKCYSLIFPQLFIISIVNMFILEAAILIFKYRHSFCLNREQYSYNNWIRGHTHLPSLRTTRYLNSFF